MTGHLGELSSASGDDPTRYFAARPRRVYGCAVVTQSTNSKTDWSGRFAAKQITERSAMTAAAVGFPGLRHAH